MKNPDYVVVGAGIVGLAAAYEIKKRFPQSKVLILEKEKDAGLHASGRNSGVLHSGIYYPPQSLKAKVCREGQKKMTAFAQEHHIPILPNGKLIIATEASEVPRIHSLMENAGANQIQAQLLGAEEIRKIEPHCRPYESGIYLSHVSVVDSTGVVQELVRQLKMGGVEFRFAEPVEAISPDKRKIKTLRENYSFGYLFNCAGAYADKLARFFGLASRYALIPFKGTYYDLRPGKNYLVHSNVYPVPDPSVPFLGVHFTCSVNGSVHVGPTAIPAFGRENYGILDGLCLEEIPAILKSLLEMFASNSKFRNLSFREWANYYKPHFVAQAKKLIPEVEPEDLVPSQKVGIRPQLVDLKKKELVMDYVIEKTPCSTHVLNAISPAFTSAFSFAELLVDGVRC